MTRKSLTESEAVDQTVDHLDQRAADLDAATLSRLSQARHAALAELEAKQSKRLRPMVWWGGGFATASACVLALYLAMSPQGIEDPALEQMLADTEILAEPEELEFFEELEFYVWLEDQELSPSEA